MADQPSLDALQEIEGYLSRILQLLNQADQDVEQSIHAIENYNNAHHENAGRGHIMRDAVAGIQHAIAAYNSQHNDIVSQINEARAEAQQRTPPGEESN